MSSNQIIILLYKESQGLSYTDKLELNQLKELMNLARADERKRIVEEIKTPILDGECPGWVCCDSCYKSSVEHRNELILSRIEADEQSLKSNNKI